jgi:hypothetical protein
MIHHRNSRCVDGAADALRPQRPAQNLAGSFAAVELAAAAVLELPALRRAQELPAVGGHAEDAEALAATVIGDRDRLTLRLRHQDLQVGRDHGGVAVDRHMG